ncbi:MAG: O-antigen ligase family protein [Acidobacteriota bacterium]
MNGAPRVSPSRPHLLIACLGSLLLLATVILGLPIPMVALGLAILLAGVATLMRPEFGLHVLVINAMVGLTHVVEMPRVGPFSAPVLIEGLVLGAILFQAAFLGRRPPIGTPQHMLLGVLAIWILISILAGVSVGPENFQQYRNLFLVRLVMFILVSAILTTSRGIKRLLVTFMIANVGLLITASLVRAGYFGAEKITVSQNFERTGALVQNPNELAFTLTTMLVVTLVAFLSVKRARLKLPLLCLAGVDLFVIMATLSRSGFISLCVVLAFLFFKLTHNMRAVSVIGILVVSGALMVPEELFARFSKIDQVQDVDRVQIMRVGMAMTRDHPLLGVGMGNYVAQFWNYNASGMKRAAPAHNMYLDLAAQMGIPALAIYLAMLLATWWSLRRMEVDLKTAGRTRTFAYLMNLGIQAFFVNLVVFGLSGDVEFDYSTFIMLGMALTLLAEHRRRRVPVGASGRN